MTDERRDTVAGAAAVRPGAPPEGAAQGTAQATETAAPAAGPADPDPPDTDPSRSDPLVPGPPIGAAEIRLLIRAQLRTALGTGAFVMTVVTALPALMVIVPAVARARVHGVPLPWLVLAFGIQPVWVAASFRQLGRAERAERDLGRPAGRR
ncbi:hypothetical protein [Actinomadura mexicana]|uniref:DUF485 domain-containing protein n=1 Tax=Actinomadura mexicana TaxID=134959 RepID=A0A238Y987_9ACTN|nr:hypothetical protein [Actinomadura mexicana]SNR67144.1 hypothetical protein SAMN06265355_105322 [Actinomadura mexicana]